VARVRATLARPQEPESKPLACERSRGRGVLRAELAFRRMSRYVWRAGAGAGAGAELPLPPDLPPPPDGRTGGAYYTIAEIRAAAGAGGLPPPRDGTHGPGMAARVRARAFVAEVARADAAARAAVAAAAGGRDAVSYARAQLALRERDAAVGLLTSPPPPPHPCSSSPAQSEPSKHVQDVVRAILRGPLPALSATLLIPRAGGGGHVGVGVRTGGGGGVGAPGPLLEPVQGVRGDGAGGSVPPAWDWGPVRPPAWGGGRA